MTAIAEPAQVTVKFCTGCESDKPITDYHHDKSNTRDGRKTRCRTCTNDAKTGARNANTPPNHNPPKAYKAPFVVGPAWQHQAACRDEDGELFFPNGNTGPALLQIEEAKAVCRRCPVVDACLQWALETGQDAGVWGGKSEDERRALKRKATRNRARATA